MALIELKEVSFKYKKDTPHEVEALKDISMSVSGGEFIGIIGSTGSGKSTLIQLLNGLLLPNSGQVLIEGEDLSNISGTNLKKLRQKIGLVFQYPENQLFEETVARDVAFGPRNMGFEKTEIEKRTAQSLELVGLDYQEYKDRSPFSLSGGQMRRVAIAGVLAMQPQVLVLDEPTAGMDPEGRKVILDRITAVHRELGMTVILVTHNMEDIARLSSKVFVLHEGRLVLKGTPGEVFSRGEEIQELGLDIPEITELMNCLYNKGKNVRLDIYTVEEAENEILKHLRSTKDA